MTWAELCENKTYRDLPHKVETNGRGQLIMSPAKGYHYRRSARIMKLIERFLGGECIPECPIATQDGTRCPDVVWYSSQRVLVLSSEQIDFPIAGEICVEVLSACNSESEMAHKRGLLFTVGAQEFWTCNEEGFMRYWNADGEMMVSALCPSFPQQVVI